MKKFILLVLLSLVLAGCNNGPCSAPMKKFAAKEISLTGDRSIELNVGQKLSISIASNPTTGYQWIMVLKADQDILRESKQSEYIPIFTTEKIVGSGGLQVFHLKALKKGSATISFDYKRSWEKVPPVENYILQIEIS